MATSSALTTQDTKLTSLGLTKMIVNKEQICTYSRNLSSASSGNPVLVLIHGYPQSSYMWRHLIPLLPASSPLFLADLPGYGGSAPLESDQYDKLSVGKAIISALKTETKRTSSKPISPIPVILIGHDRGARVSQQVSVRGVDGVHVKGACLIDIVPISTQWQASSTAAEVVGYFHWPFLANVDLATRMITAFGADNWCEEMILRWAGDSEKGLKNLKADGALDVYKSFLLSPTTLVASNKDYAAGATTDISLQTADQAANRKIKCPLLLVYSERYIGRRYDFPGVWKEWVDEGVRVEYCALGDGVGHFGAEEAPGETARALGKWLGGLGVKG